MSMSDEEKFRLHVEGMLEKIDTRGDRNEKQLTALNSTVSEDRQRITRLESAFSTVRAMVVGAITLMGLAVAAVATWLNRGN